MHSSKNNVIDSSKQIILPAAILFWFEFREQ